MPSFPDLTFLPVGDLLIHEWHDDQRTLPLIRRIQASGVFRNPPVVAPLEDGSDRYMVLDGANRVTALQEMGYLHALVQVVQPDDPGLNLHCWNHVVWELNPDRFLENIRAIPGLELAPGVSPETAPSLESDCGLAVLHLPDGQSYAVCSPARGLKDRVDRLNDLVRSYQQCARLDRTNQRDIQQMAAIYPSLSGLVVFPSFNIHDLLRLVSERYLLPAGITRFMIAPRALHLNYPLAALAADKPLEEKNKALQHWVQERLAHKGVRYYAEPTYLFDE
jgi:L-serine kinase (ATP) / ParB family transcriptional regulator, heme-responsive regulator